MSAAIKQLANTLGSVMPDKYSAPAQLIAARRYERPAALSCALIGVRPCNDCKSERRCYAANGVHNSQRVSKGSR